MSLVLNPEMAADVERYAAVVRSALAPWDAGHTYFNFAERSVDLADLFSPDTCARLGRVKAQYDPGDLIRSTHPIPVA